MRRTRRGPRREAVIVLACCRWPRAEGTYHGDNLLLDNGRERDELEEEGEVKLRRTRLANRPVVDRFRREAGALRRRRGGRGRWSAGRES